MTSEHKLILSSVFLLILLGIFMLAYLEQVDWKKNKFVFCTILINWAACLSVIFSCWI